MPSGAPERDGSSARSVVDRLFILLRTLAVHGTAHPISAQLARSLADAIDENGPPFTLQFIEEAVFHDRALVRFDAGEYQRAARVAAALDAVEVQEIAFEYTPTVDALLDFAAALGAGELPSGDLAGIVVRAIHGVHSGAAGESVEPSRAAAVMVLRALGDAELAEAIKGGEWAWSRGAAVLRRMERAADTDASVAARLRSSFLR